MSVTRIYASSPADADAQCMISMLASGIEPAMLALELSATRLDEIEIELAAKPDGAAALGWLRAWRAGRN